MIKSATPRRFICRNGTVVHLRHVVCTTTHALRDVLSNNAVRNLPRHYAAAVCSGIVTQDKRAINRAVICSAAIICAVSNDSASRNTGIIASSTVCCRAICHHATNECPAIATPTIVRLHSIRRINSSPAVYKCKANESQVCRSRRRGFRKRCAPVCDSLRPKERGINNGIRRSGDAFDTNANINRCERRIDTRRDFNDIAGNSTENSDIKGFERRIR